MNIEISDPSMAEDLVAYLNAAGAVADLAPRQNGHGRIVAGVPAFPTEVGARRTLDFFLSNWRRAHPDVYVRRIPRYDF